jgi:hypothetical protein
MTIEDLIRYGSESPQLDFKRDQYPLGSDAFKYEILKDISAFANYPGDEDKYIIIGVVEEGGVASSFCDILTLTDEAKYQEFVRANLEPEINFEYKRHVYESHQLAYFRIFNNTKRPYLFKKEINNRGKVEFRVGDGYIKHGTSTRKMNREDLERIYANRYAQQDRKSDVLITPMISRTIGPQLAEYEMACIEVMIENRSTRSINLDVEMKIVTTDGMGVTTSHAIRQALYKAGEKTRQREDKVSIFNYINSPIIDLQRFREPPIPYFNPPSLNVSFLEEVGCVRASRIRRIGETAALSVRQMDKIEFIFERGIIVIADKACMVRGEITIRSDDFSDGALVVPFELSYDSIQ